MTHLDVDLLQPRIQDGGSGMNMHYQLSDQEHAAISEAKRKGAHFDLPEMLCRTGDGHREGTRDWDLVNCPRCLQTGKTWRKYNGDAT